MPVVPATALQWRSSLVLNDSTASVSKNKPYKVTPVVSVLVSVQSDARSPCVSNQWWSSAVLWQRLLSRVIFFIEFWYLNLVNVYLSTSCWINCFHVDLMVGKTFYPSGLKKTTLCYTT